MNTAGKTWLLALLAAAAACDPFQGASTAVPQVVSAFVTGYDGDFLAPVEGTPGVAPGTWAVPGDGQPALTTQNTLWIVVSNLLDGASIQETPDPDVDPETGTYCIPAGGWLSASQTPAGTTWFTCYNPSSPTADEGGSIVIFAAADFKKVNDWFTVAVPFPSGTTTFGGTVKDQAGNALTFAVTVTAP
jgi:putative hemolysin